MKPEELSVLADRIDPDNLWRISPLDRHTLTPEQRDRLDAAVNLRRYASELGVANKKRAEGAMYITGYKLERHDGGTYGRGCGDGAWHGALNKHSDEQRKAGKPFPRWLYTAKKVSDEVRRMVLLFEHERKGLATHFKMCGHEGGKGTPLPDNHLRCHLGKECRKCEYLKVIEDAPDMTVEAKDEAKAWTCATHILLKSEEDTYFEGFLRDKGDDAFDARMARSFGGE